MAHLAQDLGVSAPTVRSWIEILERLYLVFRLHPFAGRIARGLRKESKLYFYDCAAGPVEARLENLVACALLKYCDYQRDTTGKKFSLHYFRDREGREVDFVVAINRTPHWCIEVKSTDASLSPSLRYLHRRFMPARSVQLVRAIDRPLELDDIRIEPLAEWCERLGTQ